MSSDLDASTRNSKAVKVPSSDCGTSAPHRSIYRRPHSLLALSKISTRTMSQTHPNASSSSTSTSLSNFQSVLDAALEAYERKTKSKLLTLPLAAQLQSCDSPAAILSVLQGLTQQFDRRRRGDERLTNWLTPTVNVLYAFSSAIGQGVGLVSPNSLSSLEFLSRSCHSSGILTCQRGILRHRRSSSGEHLRSLGAS